MAQANWQLNAKRTAGRPDKRTARQADRRTDNSSKQQTRDMAIIRYHFNIYTTQGRRRQEEAKEGK